MALTTTPAFPTGVSWSPHVVAGNLKCARVGIKETLNHVVDEQSVEQAVLAWCSDSIVPGVSCRRAMTQLC